MFKDIHRDEMHKRKKHRKKRSKVQHRRKHTSSEPEIPENILDKKPGYFDNLAKKFPDLKKQLIMANFMETPGNFLKKAFIRSLINGILISVLSFLLIQQAGMSPFAVIVVFIISFTFFLYFNIIKLRIIISKKRKAIDTEVVYAGRYMLLKLYSGRPLLNTLIDQSECYGVASKYVKDIVNDVNSGSSIEQSLQKAMLYTPSDKFRKILFYINNALRYGVDVSGPLEWALNEIVEEDMIEIRKYGKKMNSLMIFYMLLAVVVPSLGITIFIVITGFLNVSIGLITLFTLNFFILLVQLLFLGVIKTIRPTIEV
tara:strand:- start:16260 stop:17201 length:942 start_codon:yes stop_codon:yes gene_type:complete